MKQFRKLSAIFLSMALLVGFCIPMAVSAETTTNNPPISITAKTDGQYSKDQSVPLFISVKNVGSDPVEVTSVVIEENDSFKSGESWSNTASPMSINKGKSSPVNLTGIYTGTGNKLKVTVSAQKANGGGAYTVYTREVTVSGISSDSSGGSSGGSGGSSGGGNSGGGNNGGGSVDTPEDAKPFIYSAKQTTFRAGEASAFPLTIATNSRHSAENVRMTLSCEDENGKGGFSFQENNGSYVVDYLDDQQELKPTLVVSPSVPNGTYTLTVNFRYEDYLGNSYQASDTVRVTVQGQYRTAIYVKGATLDRSEIGKENKAKLTVEVVNPTANNFNDLTIGMNTKDSKLSLYENFQPVKLFGIDKGASTKAAFSIYADSTVTTGNYPVTFDVSYTGLNGTVYTTQETIYVLITRSADVDKDDKASKPRIIIQGYKTSAEVIEAGKNFDLDFTLQNTSADTEVTNVKVVLDSEAASTGTATTTKTNNVFFPSEGSNSFFIERIGPKGSVSNNITLTTSQDVEPGVYSLTLHIEYDSDGAAATPSDEKLAFPVAQQQRLDIQGFSVSPDTMMGSSVPVTFQYINKGKATIYNFGVDVEGDFTMEDTTMSYIGNLTSGYNDTYENYLLPTKEGECKGTILLKYEDSQGNEKEERKEFTVNVQAVDMATGGGVIGGGVIGGGVIGGASIDPETGYPIDPESGLPIDPTTGQPVQKGGILPIILWCAGGVVVVGGGIAAFLIIRKKKKAKELVEDEED